MFDIIFKFLFIFAQFDNLIMKCLQVQTSKIFNFHVIGFNYYDILKVLECKKLFFLIFFGKDTKRFKLCKKETN